MFDEYKEIRFSIDIGYVTFFMMFKMYIFTVVMAMAILYEYGGNLEQEEIFNVAKIVIPVCQAEIVIVLGYFFIDPIYNGLVWCKRKWWLK